MTKQDIIKNVAKELKIPPKEARPIVEGVLGHIRKSLESGIGLEISGYGWVSSP
jgi:nucleoid DNA-binding protein